jgi:hypothetical protein
MKEKLDDKNLIRCFRPKKERKSVDIEKGDNSRMIEDKLLQ